MQVVVRAFTEEAMLQASGAKPDDMCRYYTLQTAPPAAAADGSGAAAATDWTIVDVTDARARKQFTFDAAASSNEDLFQRTVRPLIEQITPPATRPASLLAAGVTMSPQATVVVDGSLAARSATLFAPYDGLLPLAIRHIAALPTTRALHLSAVELDEHNQLVDVLANATESPHAGADQPAGVLRRTIPSIIEDTNYCFTAIEETTFVDVSRDCTAPLAALHRVLSFRRHQIFSLVITHHEFAPAADTELLPTTIQFVSFVASEVTRGLHSTRHCLQNAASLLESRASTVNFNGTKALFLLKPALSGRQPGAWVGCFAPVTPAVPEQYREQFRDAFAVAQTAQRVHAAKVGNGLFRSSSKLVLVAPQQPQAAAAAAAASAADAAQAAADAAAVAAARRRANAAAAAAASAAQLDAQVRRLQQEVPPVGDASLLLASPEGPPPPASRGTAPPPAGSVSPPSPPQQQHREGSTDPEPRRGAVPARLPPPANDYNATSAIIAAAPSPGKRSGAAVAAAKASGGADWRDVPVAQRKREAAARLNVFTQRLEAEGFLPPGTRSSAAGAAAPPQAAPATKPSAPALPAAQPKPRAQSAAPPPRAAAAVATPTPRRRQAHFDATVSTTPTASTIISHGGGASVAKFTPSVAAAAAAANTSAANAANVSAAAAAASQHHPHNCAARYEHEAYKSVMEAVVVRLRADLEEYAARLTKAQRALRERDTTLRSGSTGLANANRELDVATRRVAQLEDEKARLQSEHHQSTQLLQRQRADLGVANEKLRRELNDALERCDALEAELVRRQEFALLASQHRGLTATAFTQTAITAVGGDAAAAAGVAALSGHRGGSGVNTALAASTIMSGSLSGTGGRVQQQQASGVPRGTQTTGAFMLGINDELLTCRATLLEAQHARQHAERDAASAAAREASLRQRVNELEEELAGKVELEVGLKTQLLRAEQALRLERVEQERRERERLAAFVSASTQTVAPDPPPFLPVPPALSSGALTPTSSFHQTPQQQQQQQQQAAAAASYPSLLSAEQQRQIDAAAVLAVRANELEAQLRAAVQRAAAAEGEAAERERALRAEQDGRAAALQRAEELTRALAEANAAGEAARREVAAQRQRQAAAAAAATAALESAVPMRSQGIAVGGVSPARGGGGGSSAAAAMAAAAVVSPARTSSASVHSAATTSASGVTGQAPRALPAAAAAAAAPSSVASPPGARADDASPPAFTRGKMKIVLAPGKLPPNAVLVKGPPPQPAAAAAAAAAAAPRPASASNRLTSPSRGASASTTGRASAAGGNGGLSFEQFMAQPSGVPLPRPQQ